MDGVLTEPQVPEHELLAVLSRTLAVKHECFCADRQRIRDLMTEEQSVSQETTEDYNKSLTAYKEARLRLIRHVLNNEEER